MGKSSARVCYCLLFLGSGGWNPELGHSFMFLLRLKRRRKPLPK
jgi:hypothetical protein